MSTVLFVRNMVCRAIRPCSSIRAARTAVCTRPNTPADESLSSYANLLRWLSLRKFYGITYLTCINARFSAVVEIKNQDDYEHYVKESPVLYLFLHGEKDTQSLAQLTSASNILLGSPKILTSSNTSLRSRFAVPFELASSPILLAIKDNIPYSASNAFEFPTSGGANKEELSQWLLANRLPAALALGQETFQEVMNAPHAPLVVIAAVNAEGESAAAELLKETAKAWRHYTENNGMPERDVVFTWMDAEKWASWMKSMYGIKSADLPAVVVTDHQVRYPTILSLRALTGSGTILHVCF